MRSRFDTLHFTLFAGLLVSTLVVSALGPHAVFAQEGGDSSKARGKAYRLVPPPAKFTPPALEVEPPDFDWGTVLQGEEVEHTFIIKNSGGAPLIIERIKPSCGCTTVKKPDQPIPPGETDRFTLRVDTKRLRNKTTKTAQVFSNDPSSPAKVSMTGVVEQLFQIDPQLPRMSVVRGADPEPLKVTLKRAKTDTPLKVVEVTSKGDVLQAEISEIEPSATYEILLTATLTDVKRKFYQEQLLVKVDSEGKTFDVPIPVSITVKERIHIEPRSSVYFNRKDTQTLSTGTPVSKELEIKSLGGEDHTFKVTAVENDGENFQTQLETVTEGKHYRLTVSLEKLPANSSQRRINERITIKTDDETIPELKITALAALN